MLERDGALVFEVAVVQRHMRRLAVQVDDGSDSEDDAAVTRLGSVSAGPVPNRYTPS